METSSRSWCRKPTKPRCSICSTFVKQFWTRQQICEPKWHLTTVLRTWPRPSEMLSEHSNTSWKLLSSFTCLPLAIHTGEDSELTASRKLKRGGSMCKIHSLTSPPLSVFMNEKGKLAGEAGPCHDCYHAVCPLSSKHYGSVFVSFEDNCFYVLNQPDTWFLMRLIFKTAQLCA